MPPRRAHHKSKLGCSNCKQRRIKCDQTRPDCRNCTRRILSCSFRALDPASRSSASSSVPGAGRALTQIHVPFQPSSPPSLPLPPPTLLDALVQNDLLEDYPDFLRPRFKQLLHHFIANTSATISHDRQAQAIWLKAVPTLVSSHRFVLQGIFAVSSLHLSRHVAVEREQTMYGNIAAASMNTGLIKYRDEVKNVTADNAEALFAFSTTTTAFHLLITADECKAILHSIRLGTLSTGHLKVAVTELSFATTKTMRFLRGVLVILVPSWHKIQSGVLGPIVKRDWWPWSAPLSPQAIVEDRQLQDLENLWARPGRPYEYWFDALIDALKKLREAFALVSRLTITPDTIRSSTDGTLTDWTSVLTWPIHVSVDFVNLLEQQCVEAWVIMAHYAILPSRAVGVWWIKDFASVIVSTAALVLGEKHWNLIKWPATIVGVDLKSLQSTSSIQVEGYMAEPLDI